MKVFFCSLSTIALALGVFSTSAHAQNVKEKKTMAQADTELASRLTAIEKKCGNAKLTAKFDYPKIMNMKDYQQKSGKTPENFLSMATSTGIECVHWMTDLCNDKDYKEAAGKVTQINLEPKGAPFAEKVKYTLKGTTLLVEYDPLQSTNGMGLDALRKAF